MAESARDHFLTVQARSLRKRRVPGERREMISGPIVVDLREESLAQRVLFAAR